MRKWLSVSGLRFTAIRRSQCRVAKWPILHSEMTHFVLRYAQYRALIWPVSGCKKAHFAKPTDFSCLSEAGIIRVDKENSVRKSPFHRAPFSISRKNFVRIFYFSNCIYMQKTASLSPFRHGLPGRLSGSRRASSARKPRNGMANRISVKMVVFSVISLRPPTMFLHIFAPWA